MANDDRDLLTVLKEELEFLEKGGYQHSPDAPWRSRFIFEDSPTCMNHGKRESPTVQRVRLDQSRSRRIAVMSRIPCRHIALNAGRVHHRYLLSPGNPRGS